MKPSSASRAFPGCGSWPTCATTGAGRDGRARAHAAAPGADRSPNIGRDDMPNTIRTVLAATDLSRPAFAAVRRSALIARAHDARLEIAHVVSDLRSAVTKNLDAVVAQVE